MNKGQSLSGLVNLENTYSLPLLERCRRRFEIIQSHDTPRKQALAYEYCRHDLIFWINSFVFTYDPRVKPSFIPFDLFPRQVEYLRWREQIRKEGANGLCEKSRDAGVTFLNAAHQLHCFLFEDDFAGGLGSRKLELVDRIGDPKAILPKIRSMLYSLPRWMLPPSFNWQKHDNFCKLINPDNGSTITGEAGSQVGRGGRTSFYDLDEAAFVEHPEAIEAALSNNTNTLFYTSSANGTNLFYQKRMSYPEAWVFTFHWTQDPRKSQAWYDQMCIKFPPEVVGSEIDIDYTASISGIFIPAIWVQAAIELHLSKSASYGYPRIAGLDVGGSGKAESCFIVRQGAIVENPIGWKEPNTTVTAFKARELAVEMDVEHVNFDSDGIGTGVESTYALERSLPFTYTGVQGQGRPSERVWMGEERTSQEKFHNKRSELWGLIRERFRKTYNHVQGLMTYPEDELISIPRDAKLIAQLSSVLGKTTATGKTLLESKLDMRERGVESPDRADALAYTEEEPLINPMKGT